MGSPDPKVASLLQLLCTPKAYQAAVGGPLNKRFWPEKAGEEYWQYIPNYLISRCPYCHLEHYAQVDTYSLLRRPHFDRMGKILGFWEHSTWPCQHFLASHPFVNLNLNQPSELDYAEFQSSEVPGIERSLVESTDVRTLAVLHAL